MTHPSKRMGVVPISPPRSAPRSAGGGPSYSLGRATGSQMGSVSPEEIARRKERRERIAKKSEAIQAKQDKARRERKARGPGAIERSATSPEKAPGKQAEASPVVQAERKRQREAKASGSKQKRDKIGRFD